MTLRLKFTNFQNLVPKLKCAKIFMKSGIRATGIC